MMSKEEEKMLDGLKERIACITQEEGYDPQDVVKLITQFVFKNSVSYYCRMEIWDILAIYENTVK